MQNKSNTNRVRGEAAMLCMPQIQMKRVKNLQHMKHKRKEKKINLLKKKGRIVV